MNLNGKINIFFPLIFAIIIFSSCDKIDGPYMSSMNEGGENGEPDTKELVRNILIYDFTGHKCGNCPRAHRQIKELKSVYGNVIVPIAIHATFFARPENNPDGRFAYDFRTEIGDILGGRNFSIDCYYGALTLPVGLINNLSSDALLSDSEWAEHISMYVGMPPEFDINIYNSYNKQADSVITNISVTALVESQRNVHLNVLIIEDGIIQWQEDYSQSPSAIEDYEHNHVLRGGFVDAFGKSIFSSEQTLNVGATIQTELSEKIDEEWVVENCSVVAFVYDYDTKEVLQAEVKAFR